jgi:hypothetical protein
MLGSTAAFRAQSLLQEQDELQTVGTLRGILAAVNTNAAVEPEDVWTLGEEHGYVVEITFSAIGGSQVILTPCSDTRRRLSLLRRPGECVRPGRGMPITRSVRSRAPDRARSSQASGCQITGAHDAPRTS